MDTVDNKQGRERARLVSTFFRARALLRRPAHKVLYIGANGNANYKQLENADLDNGSKVIPCPHHVTVTLSPNLIVPTHLTAVRA